MNNITFPMKKVQTFTDPLDHILNNRYWDTTIIKGLNYRKKIASQHREYHTHVPSIRAGVEE